jgi:ureidoacrylate peracid hydrolase
MDPKKTAVVLIEYQNDFTSEGGALHGAVKEVMEKTDMLSNTLETVQKARETGNRRAGNGPGSGEWARL